MLFEIIPQSQESLEYLHKQLFRRVVCHLLIRELYKVFHADACHCAFREILSYIISFVDIRRT